MAVVFKTMRSAMFHRQQISLRTRVAAATLLAALLSVLSAAAAAQDIKIGYVSLDRILRDSAPARAGGQKLEAEFAKRDRELQDMGAKLKAAAERFDKDAPVLTESERARRQREVQELDREFQRKQREFREDFNQRRNEEVQALIDRAQRVIKQIAEQEKFDLILQDAVTWSSRVDITDRVLKALNNGK
jgi:outer membrane protein